jgi:hypothetical protein
MAKYRVRLTRPTSESGSVIVEAHDKDEAAARALEARHHENVEWEEDDDSGRVYVGDIDEDVECVEGEEVLGPTEYLCEWRIDITAATPEEAARVAEELMSRRSQSCWHVTDCESGEVTKVEAKGE